MKRQGKVARTSKDFDHLNRLRFPGFRIKDIFLKMGDKESKPHMPWGTPDVPDKGSDKFNFLPEYETIELHYEIDDKYALADGGKLELYNRFEEDPLWSLDLKKLGPDWFAHGKHKIEWDGRVVEATAEVAAERDGDTLKHKLTDIDPKKDVHDSFPDGYVTLEHPPYKLRLTLTTEADAEVKERPVHAWTFFHILVKDIKLELGDEKAVPAAAVDDDRHKMDKAVRKRIEDDGGLTEGDTVRKVYLPSNIFKTASAEMTSNTAHDQYKTLWKDGPNIPIFAKIRMADSQGNEVKIDETDKGAVVLGRCRFFWEWEDPDEDLSGQSDAKSKTFIEKTINFDKDTTKPKGDNTHKERGGKREDEDKLVFPKQEGYDPKADLDDGKFPFKVFTHKETDKPVIEKRKWASASLGWTKGKLKGQTGVIFQPARMAGDNYRVNIFVAFDRDKKDHLAFDNEDQPLKAATVLKKSTGIFQMWREIHLVRYIAKDGVAPYLPANLGPIQAYYKECYIDVVDKIDAAANNYQVSEHKLGGGGDLDYNDMCKTLLTGWGSVLFNEELAFDDDADHASEKAAFKTVSYPDFVLRAHKYLDAAGDIADFNHHGIAPEDLGSQPALVSDPGAPPADQERDARLAATRNWIDAIKTKVEYAEYLDGSMMNLIRSNANPSVCHNMQTIAGSKAGGSAAAEGITVLHFEYTHSYHKVVLAEVEADGMAGPSTKLGSAVNPGDSGRNKCFFLYLYPMADTFAHEIGHHLFLPHPHGGGANADYHDQAHLNGSGDNHCLMSYKRPRDAFCGVCQLRLRGWDYTAFSKDATANERT